MSRPIRCSQVWTVKLSCYCTWHRWLNIQVGERAVTASPEPENLLAPVIAARAVSVLVISHKAQRHLENRAGGARDSQIIRLACASSNAKELITVVGAIAVNIQIVQIGARPVEKQCLRAAATRLIERFCIDRRNWFNCAIGRDGVRVDAYSVRGKQILSIVRQRCSVSQTRRKRRSRHRRELPIQGRCVRVDDHIASRTAGYIDIRRWRCLRLQDGTRSANDQNQNE